MGHQEREISHPGSMPGETNPRCNFMSPELFLSSDGPNMALWVGTLAGLGLLAGMSLAAYRRRRSIEDRMSKGSKPLEPPKNNLLE